MIDLKEELNEFDLTVLKAVYYINNEHKTYNSIVPKIRTITSFMRCNGKSNHYEFYKKFPDVSKKYDRFSSKTVEESLLKLIRHNKIEQNGELYYSIVHPDSVVLSCYGRLKLTQANYMRGFQTVCKCWHISLWEKMTHSEYEMLHKGQTIFKIFFKNNFPYIIISDKEYRFTFRSTDYVLIRNKIVERIKELS